VKTKDNTLAVKPGTAVSFSQDGATSATGVITRATQDSFVLAQPGTYLVQFQVAAQDGGRLVVALDSGTGVQELDFTSRAAESDQVVGMALVTTKVRNSKLSIRNPANSAAPFSVTSLAAGQNPVAAHLVIQKVR
jgi:hypothetical protein